MKKVIFILICLLWTNINSYSQEINGVAAYSIQLAEDNQPFHAELGFTLSESLFSWKQRNTSKWVKEKDNDFGIQIVYTDTLGYSIKTKIGSQMMRLRQFCGENNPIFFSDYVIHKWSISSDEKKNILGKVCSKATTRFRGRDYVVWYSTEVPVQVGPWKFYGLPGLIMQVEEAKKEVFISIKSLNFMTEFQKPEYDKDLGKNVSQSELIDCLNSEWDKFYRKNQANIAKLQSEFPDLEISDNNLPQKRPATELEFE